MPDENELHGIASLSSALGVTPRALRFYEDRGLIDPKRVGLARIYTKRDVGRLKLILRGKRLGFSLDEIKRFLDLYRVDQAGKLQMQVLRARVRERAEELLKQRDALESIIVELRDVEREATAALRSADIHAV